MAPKVEGEKEDHKNLYKHLDTLKFEPNFAVLNTKKFEEVYQMGKPLGKGSFGQVHECTLLASAGKKVSRAVKMIKKSGRVQRDQKKFK